MLLARGRGREVGKRRGQSRAVDCADLWFSLVSLLRRDPSAFAPPTSKRGNRRREAVWCGGMSCGLGIRGPGV